MKGFSRHRRWHAWIACLAILLNALAPSLSHALASPAPHAAVWEEICSAHGAATSADDPADSTPKHAQASPHCPFCAPHGGHAALPPPAVSLLLPEPAAVFLPPLFYHARQPLFAWASAPPRAPPAAS